MNEIVFYTLNNKIEAFFSSSSFNLHNKLVIVIMQIEMAVELLL